MIFGLIERVLHALLEAGVIIVIAFGARSVFFDRPIDLREGLELIRSRWAVILAIVLFWQVAIQGVFRIFYLPPISWFQLWWSNNVGLPTPVGIAVSLIGLTSAWSILYVAFSNGGVVKAILNGLFGPWKLGWRSLLVAAAFILMPRAQAWIDGVVADASARAPVAVSVSVQGLFAALLLTFVIVLITIAFIENRASDQSPGPSAQLSLQ
jgi:hypothetical protein